MSYRVVNDAKDRALQATHLCELPDPALWLETALLECNECKQLWSKHVDKEDDSRSYWEAIRRYPNKGGLVRWRSYGPGTVPFNCQRPVVTGEWCPSDGVPAT